MSTISANDLQNTSGGIPTVKGQRLIPTAWVNFNGSVIAIRDSENVSSITDNGVGQYAVNFIVTMANYGYSVSCTAKTGGIMGGGDAAGLGYALVTAVTDTGSYYDSNYMFVTTMGGQ